MCISDFLAKSFLSSLAVLLCGACQAETPEEYQLVEAFPSLEFERPVYLIEAPDETGRLYVLEQRGRVLSFPNRPEAAPDDLVVALDLSDVVRSPVSDVEGNRGHNEEGLLGLAFHPDFRENGLLFLHYSATNPKGAAERRRGVVARFRMDADRRRIDRNSEKVFLEVDQFAGNHNGGMLDFGPDGYLYLSFGDGGGAGDPQKNGQNLNTLLGTILRIDVNREQDGRPYAIPADNPLVGRMDARGELFAWGLRNVWRFAFDPETGDLWAGDVCQNEWEKIYIIEKGHNYGWPYLEGTHEFDGVPEGVDRAAFTAPIVEHPHSEMRSITGGYVYRGSELPELNGRYIYGDYVTGLIFALDYDSEKKKLIERKRIAKGSQISSFGIDRAGELYIVSLGGSIYKLTKR